MPTSRDKANGVQRSIRLTPEGLIFLVILAFVTFSSILRNVNLLIILAGMMFTAIMLNWRLAVQRVKSVSAKRRLPSLIYARSSASMVWKCENSHPTLTAFNLNIEDTISPCGTDGESASQHAGWFSRVRRKISDSMNHIRSVGSNQVRVNFTKIPPNTSRSLVYLAWFPWRGECQVGPAELTTTFPFGLLEVKVKFDNQDGLVVAPEIGTLTPQWDVRVAAMQTGSDSVKRKRGMIDDEFFALRKYRSGDNRRQIHWRSTARVGEPMVRQFDQPSDRDVAVVIDLYQDELIDQDSIETVLSFAATVPLQTGSLSQGRMAISICGKECETWHNFGNNDANAKFLRSLALAEGSIDPDVFQAIKGAGGSVAAGTPIFVISTREEPVWVRQLETGMPSSFFNRRSDILKSLAQPDTTIGRLTDQVRWLTVPSDAFASIFSRPSIGQVTETDSGDLPATVEIDSEAPGTPGMSVAANTSTQRWLS